MPKILSLKVSNLYQKTDKGKKLDAKGRWELLRQIVMKGQHKKFIKNFQGATIRKTGRDRLTIPSNFIFEDEDSAADKFTKLVASQVQKIRQSRNSTQSESSSKTRKSLTPEEVSKIKKEEDVYKLALSCVVFPLLDHNDLLQSNDSLNQPQSPVNSIIDSITKKFGSSQQESQTQFTASSKISHAFMKMLREKCKEWLKSNSINGENDSSMVDGIYFHGLASFYNEVIKKNSSQILSAGTTYADLVSIFEKRVKREINSAIETDSDHKELILSPFQDEDQAAFARVQIFVDLMKQIIDEIQTNELAEVNKRHQRRVSKFNGQKNHKRSKSKIGVEKIQGQGQQDDSILEEGSQKESTVADQITKPSQVMAECLKQAFGIKRNFHEKHIQYYINSDECDQLSNNLKKRLTSLEPKDIQFNEYYQSEVSFLHENEALMHYWRKIEKKELAKLVNRIDKLYINGKQEEDKTVYQSLEKRLFSSKNKDKIKLKVRVVEAKDLALKNGNDKNDPYVAVEWNQERYETNVINDSVLPFWDQEIQLEMKPSTKKPLKITVWDKDEQDPGILSKKFWKDEADDFLGQVIFDIPSLLIEVNSTKIKLVDKWFKLEKRSSRSHVSGELRLMFELVSEDSEDDQAPKKVPSKFTKQLSNESVDSLVVPSQIDTLTAMDLYSILLTKLFINDCLRKSGELGEGSLSSISLQILEEFAQKYRLNKTWCKFQYLCTVQKLLCDASSFDQISSSCYQAAATLSKMIPAFDQVINDGKLTEQCVKIMVPSSEEIDASGNVIYNPPVVSGSGEVFLYAKLVQEYSKLLQNLFELVKSQIQHYKDCFPCDTPKGALINMLLLLNELLETQYKSPEVFDSAVSLDNDSQPTSPKKETMHSVLFDLLQTGTLERFLRISELANPVQEDPIGRLIKLANLIVEEVDADKTYFETSFAADIDVVSVTSSIYLKYYILEMESFSQAMLQTKTQSKPMVDQGSNIFDLVYAIAELQEKIVSNLRIAQDEYQSELKETFSVHRWMSPCIHQWLVTSEQNLLQWVQGSIDSDRFECINQEGGLLHSTSVVDLFFCLNQMAGCIQRLEYEKLGGACEDEELNQRLMYFYQFLTRFARIINRGLSKYGEILSTQVMNERLQFIKRVPNKDGLDVALSGLLNSSKKQANNSVKSLTSQIEWLQDPQTTFKLCVKVNNIEAARVQLNEFYSQLKVDTISDWMQAHKKPKNQDEIVESDNELNGGIILRVVLAENLIPCDSNGLSDPYCVINVKELVKQDQSKTSYSSIAENSIKTISPQLIKERSIAKTKVVIANLNPKWKEEFSTILKSATEMTVTVFDQDMFGRDDVCGQCVLDMKNVKQTLSDGLMHDIWVDLKPQGKVLLRMQVDSSQSISSNSGLADIDFYFRKSFRELKRYSNDLMGLFSESLGQSVKKELVKILKDVEKKGNQGAGDPEFRFSSIFSSSGAKSMDQKLRANHTDQMLISSEQVDQYLIPITDYLNEALCVLSQSLYPRLSKDLLRMTWKEILTNFESLMLPSLHGDIVSLSSLNRNKALTQKQVQTLKLCLEVLKIFFNADESELGVPMNVLESNKYKELTLCFELYWDDFTKIVTKYDELVFAEIQSRDDELNRKSILNSDTILQLIRIRSVDKDQVAIFKSKMAEREKQKSLVQQSNFDFDGAKKE